MDKSAFLLSLQSDNVPLHISSYAMALWFDAKGDWERAHEIIQNIDDRKAERIHAYLHRKEGDIINADYWYQRANAKRPSLTLGEEWELLLGELL